MSEKEEQQEYEQRIVKYRKKAGKKGKKGRKSTLPQADNIKQFMTLRKPFQFRGDIVRPLQLLKVPIILKIIGKYEFAQGRLQPKAKQQLIDKIRQIDPNISEAEANAGILGIKSGTNQQRIYGSFSPFDLINDAHQTRDIIQYGLDPQAGIDNRLANQNYLMDINARHDEPSQDIGSRQQPTAPNHSIYDSEEQMMRWFGGDPSVDNITKNRQQEKDYPDNLSTKPAPNYYGYKSNDNQPFSYPLAEQTDFAPSVTITEVESENQRDRQVEEQQLNNNIQEINKKLQYLGGLDWELDPVNRYYGKTPHIPKPIDYYLQDSALTVRQRKRYLDKEEQLNKPKQKINYIKAGEMAKQVEAQGKLKKQTRKKKSPTKNKSKKK
ncbi:MAG: hypothetical protein EZS28_033716 [Streblomastix strix]|uniref:Uncharacterized protein n=1 Tax=Streblomastix strix TaxID=222440 RepID=A0A5J4UK18_9EUKA|nr:MAG: hypothetical protein EZS28_033716 [Streblomastix strix]